MKRFLEWLVLALIALAGLALGSAHVPAELRKLVLFPMLLGLIAAALLGFLAQFSGVPRVRPATVAAALLILGTGVAATILHWRIHVLAFPPVVRDPDAEVARRRIESADPGDDPEARARHEALLRAMREAEAEGLRRREAARSLSAYLANRVSPVGRWPAPWPLLFWLAELALAATAGTLLFRRLFRPGNSGHPDTAGTPGPRPPEAST